jgi:hypothetical protein
MSSAGRRGSVAGWTRRCLLGIPLTEAHFARRGFRGRNTSARQRLERIGETFLQGYGAAIETGGVPGLQGQLETTEPELQGFAYEGAAMGLAVLDQLTPWRPHRVRDLLAGPGDRHAYMVHVGIGWVWARLRLRVETRLPRCDPLLRWLAVDGCGFHEGYFHYPRAVDRKELPHRFKGYARRAFDQGLGRSLWFVEGADVDRIPETIGSFPSRRRADLWSGVGLALAYAGGVPEDAIVQLCEAAGAFRSAMAQGGAFAAQARRKAGNPAPHTELACAIVCGMTAEEAADVTEAALEDLPPDGEEPSYEIWRRRIRERLALGVSPCS